jgi:hypothetical protein
MAEGTIKNHCLGSIPSEMWAQLARESGNAAQNAVKKAEGICGGPGFVRPADTYGEDLLFVVQRCEGNRMCALTLQPAFTNCYLAGLNESFRLETEKALARMLATCDRLHAERHRCTNEALSMMGELRTMAGNLQKLRHGQ